MQILAFDFGTKNIGVAVGQTITRSSSPLTIIFNSKNKINWPAIEEVIDEWKPELIIVGRKPATVFPEPIGEITNASFFS